MLVPDQIRTVPHQYPPMQAEQPVHWAGSYMICPILMKQWLGSTLSLSYHKNGKVEALALNIRRNLIALMHICNTSISSPIACTTNMDWDSTTVSTSHAPSPHSFLYTLSLTIFHLSCLHTILSFPALTEII